MQIRFCLLLIIEQSIFYLNTSDSIKTTNQNVRYRSLKVGKLRYILGLHGIFMASFYYYQSMMFGLVQIFFSNAHQIGPRPMCKLKAKHPCQVKMNKRISFEYV